MGEAAGGRPLRSGDSALGGRSDDGEDATHVVTPQALQEDVVEHLKKKKKKKN